MYAACFVGVYKGEKGGRGVRALVCYCRTEITEFTFFGLSLYVEEGRKEGRGEIFPPFDVVLDRQCDNASL